MRVLFRWRPSKVAVKGEDSQSCGDVSWERLAEEPEDLSHREPVSGGLVRIVPDVTDVLVSTSSVVTEFCAICTYRAC